MKSSRKFVSETSSKNDYWGMPVFGNKDVEEEQGKKTEERLKK